MNVKVMVVMLAAVHASASAAENADIAYEDLNTVYVEGKRVPDGAKHLDAEDIRRTPKRNGTITELLKNNGAVQFSSTTNQSAQAGEISPEMVSFHGEPYYNNSFLLDGLSNSDTMNPGYSNGGFKSVEEDFETAPTTLYLAPGSPESFQVDSSLLKDVNVYDSNVPARYSHFTGGVVDAQLADPDPKKAGGSISFRTTRSAWTNYHLTEDQNEEEFDAAYAENDVQPRFVKQIYNLNLNQPVGERSALLLGYNRTQSKIPEYHQYIGNGEWKDEKRLAQTWLLKGLHELSDGHTLSATLMYSPHQNTYYRTNTPNSRYTNNGGGWRFSVDSKWKTEWADIDSTLAYSRKRNKISYDAGYDSYQWLGNRYDTDSSLTWCTQMSSSGCARAYEGGFGTLESETKTWTAKQDYRLNPLKTGSVEHQLDFGWHADIERAESARPQAARYLYSYYNTARNGWPANITNVSKNCFDCIPGEQYQTHMTYFPDFHAKAKADSYAVYFSDGLQWNKLRANLGVNATYDSFLSNFNIAPRFSFDYDAAGNNRLHIIGGLNRYYADDMLAYALRAGIPANRSYTRINDRLNGQGAWTLANANMNNSQTWKVGELDTPYSDEANLGLRYRFGNQILNAKWVHRKSRDQFTPEEDSDGNNVVVNGGRGNSNHYSFTIDSAKPYQLGIWEIGYSAGARYHRYRTNYNGNYEDALTMDMAEAGESYYLRDGKRYGSLSEMPPMNFNNPWSAFLELRTDIPKWHFKWTHNLNFRAAYKNYVRYTVSQCANSSQPQACGDWTGRVYDYRLRDYKQAVTLDWKFLWELPVKKNKLEVSLDVLNVFDKKISAASSASTVGGTVSSNIAAYEVGRQYWFGAAYRW